MAGDTMRFRNPAGHAGLLNNLLALVNSLAGFFESRIGLVREESKAALVHLLVLAGMRRWPRSFSSLFGYVFLIVARSWRSRMRCIVSWIWIALARPGCISFWRWFACLIVRSRIDRNQCS